MAFFSLGLAIPFPGDGDRRRRLGSIGSYCAESPSIWRRRDHSAGRSARRATPIPWGSRPSIAALTRLGARNASEMVMLIFRTLHPSRFAIASGVVVVASDMSSSSQRRPRAIDVTRVARVSDRIGLECSRRTEAVFGYKNFSVSLLHSGLAPRDPERVIRSRRTILLVVLSQLDHHLLSVDLDAARHACRSVLRVIRFG